MGRIPLHASRIVLFDPRFISNGLYAIHDISNPFKRVNPLKMHRLVSLAIGVEFLLRRSIAGGAYFFIVPTAPLIIVRSD